MLMGAVGGRAELMELLAPTGSVYQAGTLSGNPLAMAAGIETLDELRSSRHYITLEESAAALAQGLQTAADEAEVPVTVNRIGSMMTPFFQPAAGQHTAGPVRTWEDADAADREAYGRFFHGMLDRGVYPPPAQFEAWFLSVTHSNQDIERTIQAAREALAGAKGN